MSRIASVLNLVLIVLIWEECVSGMPQSGLPLRARRHNYHHSQRSSKTTASAQLGQKRLSSWIESSLEFFQFQKCTLSNIGTEVECFKLNQVNKSQIAVYVGWDKTRSFLSGGGDSSTNTLMGNRPPRSKFGIDNNSHNNGKKVYAILPDSINAKASGAHDIVLALDPSPTANFGHLVGLFYIDFGVDVRACKDHHQIFTQDEVCITVGKRLRCPNLLETYTGAGAVQPKKCHIDFLPTVYTVDTVNTALLGQPRFIDTASMQDLLECTPQHGFAPCPKLRPLEDTSKVLCHSPDYNSKRCDTSQGSLGTNCRIFLTCDQAVLIGGGWSRQFSGVESYNNILTIEKSLKSTGFFTENIKTFFANGKATKGDSNENVYDRNFVHRRSQRHGDYFASSMKTTIRGHIKTVCESKYCSDTLFIYLNNPTNYEGDFLLWDVDYDGMTDELEVYTVKEFISDLSKCQATRVIILADQSNTDILMANLKTSSEHRNVVLFTAGLPNETPTNGEFTRKWAASSHPANCLKHVVQNTSGLMNDSNPATFDSSGELNLNLSLSGAPCDLDPPIYPKDLKYQYQGCQTVPTSVWFQYYFEEDGDYSPGIEEQDEHFVVGINNSETETVANPFDRKQRGG